MGTFYWNSLCKKNGKPYKTSERKGNPRRGLQGQVIHGFVPVSHRGVSSKARSLVIKSYLCVKVTVRCINLNIVRISNYQDELHDKIKELHDGGLGYRRIAYWLNDNGYLTPRGKVFKNTHVFSILKKRRIREERINRPFELTFGKWYEKELKGQFNFRQNSVKKSNDEKYVLCNYDCHC
ncbi:MAG: recombinase family protein [Paracoccaceae bacterium]